MTCLPDILSRPTPAQQLPATLGEDPEPAQGLTSTCCMLPAPIVKVSLLPLRHCRDVAQLLRGAAASPSILPGPVAGRDPTLTLLLLPYIRDCQAFSSHSTHKLITLFRLELTDPAPAQEPPSTPPTDP